MRKLFSLLLLCYSSATLAQQPAAAPYKLFFEKAYLHTDREAYADGDDIWFSAYLLNGQYGQLFDASNNLYVELISPDSKIAERKVMRLDKGLGNGDFHLADSIAPGSYRLRAYTNWMRNFGDNFIFEKKIQVYSSLATTRSDLITDSRYRSVNRRYARKYPAGTVLIDTAYHIYFFPESGLMVENVKGKVGFKAVSPFGRGVAASGKLTDQNGKMISTFTCDSTGLGYFELEPLNGQSYTATGLFNDLVQLKAALPQALLQGWSLSTATKDTVLLTTIKLNQPALNAYAGRSAILAVRSKGKVCYSEKVPLNALSTGVQIPLWKLAAGLCAVSLYDDVGKPHCERLVYNDAAAKPHLSVHTDKVSYAPKEKVQVVVSSTGPDGLPVKAQLSVSVTDASVVPQNGSDIVSYLNLQSEIRGTIEHAARYFDTSNPDRSAQLDLLLLTQGWRSYSWRTLADSALRISYMIEKGMTISGRVRRIWYNQPIEKTNITLQAFKAKGDKLFAAQTDTAGRFFFDNVNLYGRQLVRIYSMKNASRGSGILEDYPVFEPPLKVNYLQPDTTNLSFKYLITDSLITARKEEQRKWRLSDTIVLKEVAIGSRKSFSAKTPPPPQKFYLNDKFRKNYKVLGHFLLAECEYCGLTPDGQLDIGFIFKGNRSYPSSRADMLYLSMDKVESVRIDYRYGSGLNSIATVYVRADAFENNLNIKYFYVDGYYTARTFYAPKYESPSSKTDLRSTIHWEPSITTNEKGEATITYYNADPKTKVRIVAEGITATGQPVVGTAVYEVK